VVKVKDMKGGAEREATPEETRAILGGGPR